MKKKIVIVVIVLLLVLLVPIPRKLKDGGSIEFNALLYQIKKVKKLTSDEGYQKGVIVKVLGFEVYNDVSFKLDLDEDENGYVRMVMIKDKVYYDTKKESFITGRCGNMDGSITSHISKDEVPSKNDMANFEGNYSYQFVSDGVVDVLIDDRWITFKTKDNLKTIKESQLVLEDLEQDLEHFLTVDDVLPKEEAISKIVKNDKLVKYAKRMKGKLDEFLIVQTDDLQTIKELDKYFKDTYQNYRKVVLDNDYTIYKTLNRNDYGFTFTELVGTIKRIEKNEFLLESLDGTNMRVHHNFSINLEENMEVAIIYNGNVNDSMPEQLAAFYIEVYEKKEGFDK